MINLAVISIKEILNFFLKLIVGIILLIMIFNIIGNIKNGNYVRIEDLKTKRIYNYSKIIDKTVLLSNYYNSPKESKNLGIKRLLGSELAILGTEEELMEKENQEEVIEFENINNLDVISSQESNLVEDKKEETKNDIENDNKLEKINTKEIQEKLPTKVIEENNKTDKFTDVYKNVKIKNESKYELTEEIVTPNYTPNNKNDIIIYHTHTCESYTQTEQNKYEPSGNFRTTDLNFNVTRVGTELENNLKSFGLNVIHNSAYHDYPAYTGSYTRSLATIKNVLNTLSSEIVFDIHRDALGSNSSYAPSIQIGDEIAAQLMFVIGTDGGGLEHSNWKNNLKFAIKIQEKANEMYPGFFKPIILRDSRYNQHVASGASIIEVGATGNTLEQCIVSMKYFSKVLDEVLNEE